MPRIAIIQFPGFNCETETRRAIREAGLEADLFRWNDDYEKLAAYDGYVLPGGFSYEDRGRAGLIASLDPAMDALIKQVDAGKPLLGICNGAQVLIETGLIPGAPDRNLLMCLARNKRIQNGRVLGTGFYNTWVHMKTSAPQKRTPFTHNLLEDTVFQVPVAHGEGRFTTNHPNLLSELIDNNQIIFRYCDAGGSISDEFPTNPNGALHSMAALSNPAGNVLGVMPHPERGFTAPIEAIFNSLNDWFSDKKIHASAPLRSRTEPVFPTTHYELLENSLEFIIDLIITDNEAESLQSALHRKGFDDVRLKRSVHYEVGHAPSTKIDPFLEEIKSSGTLYNLNKETVNAPRAESKSGHTFAILVRDREDFVGQSKAYGLRQQLGNPDDLMHVTRGTLWHVTVREEDARKAEEIFHRILATNIFYNHHAQTVVWK